MPADRNRAAGQKALLIVLCQVYEVLIVTVARTTQLVRSPSSFVVCSVYRPDCNFRLHFL